SGGGWKWGTSGRLPEWGAGSQAVTVMTFLPLDKPAAEIVHSFVPIATPLPPRSLLHRTCTIGLLSVAVPPIEIDPSLAVYDGDEVGSVIRTVGGVTSPGAALTTLRIEKLKVSEKWTVPIGSNATPCSKLIVAPTALTRSGEKPGKPLPAIVRITPSAALTNRIRILNRSAISKLPA